jgi:cell wall-associated NlpC family hydrolase
MYRNIFIIIVLMSPVPACLAGQDGAAWAPEVSTAAVTAISPAPLTPAAADGIVFQALALHGVEYKRGGKSPVAGLDCSGLVRYVFHEAQGIDLPNTARELARIGEKVKRDALQPGDLVFYNTLRRAFSHVGIYLGDNRFIHAPSTGGEVRIDDMTSEYWAKRFSGARRITGQPLPQ